MQAEWMSAALAGLSSASDGTLLVFLTELRPTEDDADDWIGLPLHSDEEKPCRKVLIAHEPTLHVFLRLLDEEDQQERDASEKPANQYGRDDFSSKEKSTAASSAPSSFSGYNGSSNKSKKPEPPPPTPFARGLLTTTRLFSSSHTPEQKADEPSIQCKLCQKFFKRQDSMRRHMRQIHLESSSVTKKKAPTSGNKKKSNASSQKRPSSRESSPDSPEPKRRSEARLKDA